MTREEAIEIIKEFINSTCLHLVDQEALETLIPELKESEDEKIRKEMIRYFTEMKKGGSAALPYDDCIAYLERQKEQKPADEAEKFFDSVESYNQGFVAGQKKMKEDIEKGFGISEHSLDYLAGRYAGYAAARQEQKPAEWNEEDEKMRNALWSLLKIHYAQDDSRTSVGIEAGKFRKWLDSLPLQSHSEDDKKDDKSIDCDLSDIDDDFQGLNSEAICNSYKGDCVNCPHNRIKNKNKSLQSSSEWRHYMWATNLRFDFTALIKYDNTDNYEIVQAGNRPKQEKNGIYILIKDIKPQSHWKPSEEQMKAIKHAYNSFPNDCSTKSNLRLLYHDLEKLM